MFNKPDNRFILKWAKKIRAINILGSKCAQCGCDDIFVMTFHHPNKDKENNVNKLKYGRWSVMEHEVRKCILSCSRCHAAIHCHNDRNMKIKQHLLDLKGSNGCSECGYIGNGLDFHHIGIDKDFNFGDVIGRKIYLPLEVIVAELDKCNVLCRNCHFHKHFDMNRFNQFRDEIYRMSVEHKECPKPVDVSRVSDLLAAGIHQSEIARRLGCAKTTISGIVKKNGLVGTLQ